MNRLIFFVLLASATIAADLPAQSSRDTVRYDGIYQSQEVEWMEWGRDSVRTWNYLRFTPDGMVIGFPTIGTPEQLGNFSLVNKMLPNGRVILRDGRISFSVSEPDRSVVVDYEGYVEGDRLYLSSHSHFNGRRANPVFAFVPIPAATLRMWDGIRPE
ncbi:MAG TPA: hypothetical protein VEQ60_26040 [Longimicrobium sp.]|nr:hypothetical protein [Longimicrobium sp.]